PVKLRVNPGWVACKERNYSTQILRGASPWRRKNTPARRNRPDARTKPLIPCRFTETCQNGKVVANMQKTCMTVARQPMRSPYRPPGRTHLFSIASPEKYPRLRPQFRSTLIKATPRPATPAQSMRFLVEQEKTGPTRATLLRV